MRLVFLSALFLLSFSLFAQSEHYNFSKLDIYNGLSHNQVTTILKDDDGFLWFGTVSGLNRYDGYSCKIFRKKQDDSTALPNNSISALYQLPNRKMRVMAGGVPCIYNSYTEKSTNQQTQ